MGYAEDNEQEANNFEYRLKVHAFFVLDERCVDLKQGFNITDT